MSIWLALPLMAAGAGAPVPTDVTRSPVTASARATVIILSGAKISLSEAPQPEGYKVTAAVITDQDGNRRPAKLVEFQ
ncbi:hypothetical protein [Sphingomonas alba]|uniref:Uncharacterized protein n=1 Tax=Sphingomonas alba TaxID=2908208 RepID=A0ABT0RMH7_9SPHN|nr:hypothetical protein [Sphingomonas alba]MCL6683851.1 hypothetical protein [Sphingomonas alba]